MQNWKKKTYSDANFYFCLYVIDDRNAAANQEDKQGMRQQKVTKKLFSLGN